MKKLVYFCQGESHKAINKVCQDYTECEIDDNVSIAVLSDGHGGDAYFRSDVGSKYAVLCTIEKVKQFVENISDSVFRDKPFTAVSALTTERKQENLRKNIEVDKQLNQLFASILYAWQTEVEKHAKENPYTDEELKLIADPNDLHSIDKTYGCTLMCYVRARDYWFAFQIGDGKIFSFDNEGNWKEPVPWDERCFLNKTTSICDNDAISEFRYCYEGDGYFPTAMFLASDGLDDSFGEDANQANFYIQVLKLVDNNSDDDAQKEIEETLPQLSKIGSQDDMSIACVYDEHGLHNIVPKLIVWQRDGIKKQIDETNNKINYLKEKQLRNIPLSSYTEKELIEALQAQTELDKLYSEKNVLVIKYNRFSKELDSDKYAEYTDEVGFCEQNDSENNILTSEEINDMLKALHNSI